jgi:hypothetical protein
MYARDLSGDGAPELVLVTTSGIGGEHLKVYTVGASSARKVFNEFYRVDAAFVYVPKTNTVDLYVTTADSAAMPYRTTRYVWAGGRYQRAAEVPYTNFEGALKRQFRSRS